MFEKGSRDDWWRRRRVIRNRITSSVIHSSFMYLCKVCQHHCRQSIREAPLPSSDSSSSYCKYVVAWWYAIVQRIIVGQFYDEGVFLTASRRTRRRYSLLLLMKSWYASDWAGLFGLGSSSKSWIPIKICLTVIAGRHPSSSFKIDKQMVPDGYTLGWNKGGTNLPGRPSKKLENWKYRYEGHRYIEEQQGIHFDLHLGGLLGYSSLNSIETLNTPPSQSVPSFPGIPASHFMILEDPSCFGW